MKTLGKFAASLLLVGVTFSPLTQAQDSARIPAGSKVFIDSMDGFGSYLEAAFEKKKTPLVVVVDKNNAEFIVSGASDSQKASTAKKIITWNWHSREEAGIVVTSVKTGEVVFAYSVHKESSAHGKRSTAEACAKHLNDKISKE